MPAQKRSHNEGWGGGGGSSFKQWDRHGHPWHPSCDAVMNLDALKGVIILGDVILFLKFAMSVKRQLHIIRWKPEGCYEYSKKFRCEPEGRYRCTKSMAIAPFWFSMEYLWIVIAPFRLSTDNMYSFSQTMWQTLSTLQKNILFIASICIHIMIIWF